MNSNTIDLTAPEPQKLRVVADEPPPLDPTALKLRIAEKGRADSRDLRRLTPEREVLATLSELEPAGLHALIAEMSTEGAYADIKAVIAVSGRIYLFSEKYLIAVEAAELGRLEEAKLEIVARIRSDSSRIVLTTLEDLEPLFPFPEPERRAALLAEIRADERFQDIQSVTGPKGETYYHSDRYMSGNYGAIMMRARSGDPCWSIAELVRDRSRIMPAPTRTTVFDDPVFLLEPGRLGAILDELLAKEGYEDVKRIIHPKTKAQYLYSTRFLEERRALDIMDWEEVGMLKNP
jgi:hypothetical protein